MRQKEIREAEHRLLHELAGRISNRLEATFTEREEMKRRLKGFPDESGAALHDRIRVASDLQGGFRLK